MKSRCKAGLTGVFPGLATRVGLVWRIRMDEMGLKRRVEGIVELEALQWW